MKPDISPIFLCGKIGFFLFEHMIYGVKDDINHKCENNPAEAERESIQRRRIMRNLPEGG